MNIGFINLSSCFYLLTEQNQTCVSKLNDTNKCTHNYFVAIIHASWHPQLWNGVICWRKVLLPACPCWWQLARSTQPSTLRGTVKWVSASRLDDSSLQVNSQAKLVGLVWGLAAIWRSVSIHQMNWMNPSNEGTINIVTGISIIRPHRSTTYIHAAYCYRLSSVVCLSVSLSQ